MAAAPQPTGNDPPHRGPTRPRRDLIPLSAPPDTDQTTSSWFLGASGLIAHRPAPPATSTTGTLRPVTAHTGDSHPPLSRCQVFLSQVPAGPNIERCLACLDDDRLRETY
jgi:hypothetical protein